MTALDKAVEILGARTSGASYDVVVGPGLLAKIGQLVSQRGLAGRAVVISDETVGPLYGSTVVSSLHQHGVEARYLTIPAGETSKSVAEAQRLWNQLAEWRVDRSSWIVALGGGVVGDLAGFVAATYTRGLRWVPIPTTLMSQVDSSIGGKVGINLPAAKNMVGAFWQPSLVLTDPAVLSTLDDATFADGLAEVVKYGMALDRGLFEFVEQHVDQLLRREPEHLMRVITLSAAHKIAIVQEDERDTSGRRAVLNYGHTLAHALESTGAYRQLSHGRAVAVGMTMAARLAAASGRIDGAIVQRQSDLLARLGLPVSCTLGSIDEILRAMELDKKTRNGRLAFVLPVELGRAELVSSIDPALVRRTLETAGD
jgi:3-dehydroquinate synthase